MKSIEEKLAKTIAEESSKPLEDNKIKELELLLTNIKKTGLIKQPNYNYPLVDTIGKTYYSAINKRK